MSFFPEDMGPHPFCWWCGHSVSFHKPGGKCLRCPEEQRVCGPKLEGEPVRLDFKKENK